MTAGLAEVGTRIPCQQPQHVGRHVVGATMDIKPPAQLKAQAGRHASNRPTQARHRMDVSAQPRALGRMGNFHIMDVDIVQRVTLGRTWDTRPILIGAKPPIPTVLVLLA
jgi:hypothetical protein